MAIVTPERRRAEPPPPAPPQYEPPRPRREVPWGLITLGILIIAVFGGVSWVRGVIPDFHNPFAETTVDRSGPAVLKSIQDLQEYHAATGNFQQIVALFGDDTESQREVYLLAEEKIRAAAQNGSGLVPRAEDNTRKMLQSLLRSLGFTRVVVNFEPA